jgi:hypothetical protein
MVDIIIADRMNSDQSDVAEKVFTRDLYGDDEGRNLIRGLTKPLSRFKGDTK